MSSRIKKLLQIRTIRLSLEIALILVVLIAVRSYMQRDLAQGLSPPLQGVSTDGQTLDLKNLNDKPLLLYFWATWCPVCKMQQSAISSISKDYNVLTVAMDSGSEQDINHYLKQNNLAFTVISDPDGVISRRFGVTGVPTSFILNPDRSIEFTEVGYTTEWGIRLRLWMVGD